MKEKGEKNLHYLDMAQILFLFFIVFFIDLIDNLCSIV